VIRRHSCCQQNYESFTTINKPNIPISNDLNTLIGLQVTTVLDSSSVLGVMCKSYILYVYGIN